MDTRSDDNDETQKDDEKKKKKKYFSINTNETVSDGTISLLSLKDAAAASRHKDSRCQHQTYIASILPVDDVECMSAQHWEELFYYEQLYMTVDWCGITRSPILGKHKNIMTRDHRYRIVNWMSEACLLFHWSAQTYFVSVHAWDCYILLSTHEIAIDSLAKISAACLYFAAQLVESAADENIKSLEEFVAICPEVGSVNALRETEAHLIDTLQGISLVRRTPVDFFLLLLAQLQIAPPPCPNFFQELLNRNLLDVLWELVLALSLAVYSNGLILDGLPGSFWVIGAIYRMLQFCCPFLETDSKTKQILFAEVFHVDSDLFNDKYMSLLDPVIKSVWHRVVEHLTAPQQFSIAQTNNLDKKPYRIIQCSQFPSFSKWQITVPSNPIVQDTSNQLCQLFCKNSISLSPLRATHLIYHQDLGTFNSFHFMKPVHKSLFTNRPPVACKEEKDDNNHH